MFESNVFDFFSEDDIQKPIQLKAIIGPDLIPSSDFVLKV